MNTLPSILDGFPRLVPFIQERHGRDLDAAALADGHRVLAPTHVVVKAGQVVGYGSIIGIPTVAVWLDSKRVQARESLSLLNTAECLAAARGAKFLMFPCEKSSPFHPVMERLGFDRITTADLFIKTLT